MFTFVKGQKETCLRCGKYTEAFNKLRNSSKRNLTVVIALSGEGLEFVKFRKEHDETSRLVDSESFIVDLGARRLKPFHLKYPTGTGQLTMHILLNQHHAEHGCIF